MGLSHPRDEEPGSAGVELLNGSDRAPVRADRRSRSAVAVCSVMAIVLLLVLLLVAPIRLPTEVGRLQTVEVHFGDPFAVEWQALTPQDETTISASEARPLPMASLDPACVGFGRLDWPEERRQPTVAHCVAAEDIARLTEGSVAVVREILVGQETWYLLRFGGRPIEVMIERRLEAGTGDPITVEPEPIYRVGPYAAVLLPNQVRSFEATWELAGGARYRCDVKGPPGC